MVFQINLIDLRGQNELISSWGVISQFAPQQGVFAYKMEKPNLYIVANQRKE